MELAVQGVKTHLVREGKGSPVLLLHGLGSSSYSWRRVLPALAERHDVCAVDLPGFGRSGKPDDFDYSFKGFGDWVLALMDALGWDKAAIAGNSMGGGTGMRVALHRPERVTRLAMLGAPMYADNRPKLLEPFRWPLIGRLCELIAGEWLIPTLARNCFVDQSIVTAELIEEYSIALREPGGRRAAVSFLRNAVPPDVHQWTARYPSIKTPILAIHGQQDRVIDGASLDRFLKECPSARALRVPSCGHAPQEERPDVVVPALMEFFGAS